MSATQFVEERTAVHPHQCTLCGAPIGEGDGYRREAVPPWAFHGKDEEGHWVDYGDGHWLVIKVCYDCKGSAK